MATTKKGLSKQPRKSSKVTSAPKKNLSGSTSRNSQVEERRQKRASELLKKFGPGTNAGMCLTPFGQGGKFADLIGVRLKTVTAKEVINPNGFQPLEREYQHEYGEAVAVVILPQPERSREEMRWAKSFRALGGEVLFIKS